MAEPPLLPVDDAIGRIAEAMPAMEPETVPLADAIGRVLADPVKALVSHPPAAVSAMDGYAARSADLVKLPADLAVIGESAAGRPFAGPVGARECVRIFTGAHVPEGADTIVPQEDTGQGGAGIEIREAPDPGRHIRPEGNDYAEGDALLPAGTALSARGLALAGSAGHGTLTVLRRPVVAVVSTGDELVEPGTRPAPHQIVSSNGIFLERLLASLGAEPLGLGIIGDGDGALEAVLEHAPAVDLVVTSGGASVGEHDGIARLMADSGGLRFWKIAMRPGKPLIFGHLERPLPGAGRVPLLGLPGNPVSTGVCGVVFVAAAVRAMLGRDPAPRYRHAVLTGDLPANDRRQEFLRARLEHGDDGRVRAEALTGQDSGMMAVFARADALIMRPADAPAAKAGEVVPVLPLPF